MTDNRIEERIKPVVELLEDVSEFNIDKAHQIDEYYCQLFPQPLEEGELRGEVWAIFKENCGYHNKAPCPTKGFHMCVDCESRVEKILALLPSIEEARRQGKEETMDQVSKMPVFIYSKTLETTVPIKDAPEWEALKGGK